jgi:hypothetical protein
VSFAQLGAATRVAMALAVAALIWLVLWGLL